MSFELPPIVMPVDNSQLAAGVDEWSRIVAGGVARVNASLKGLQVPAQGLNGLLTAGGAAYANPAMLGGQGYAGSMNTLRVLQRDTGRLGTSLDRIGRQFTGGLGIGTTVAGFALFERALDKAIVKAREFQTATLSIAATMSSLGSRTDTRTGKTLSASDTFDLNLREAEKIRRQILARSARTILTFQEQIGAFESSLNPGTRKGLTTQQTVDLSERAAIVAKTLGLRGEQISNASRLLLGGGVNVARSTIGRALGIQNQDVAGRYGKDLYRFLDNRMKGFTQAQDEFAGSIEGILSTIESRVDTMLAMAGERFFKNPKVKGTLGKLLQGIEKPERKAGESQNDFDARLKEWGKDSAELNQTIDSLAGLFEKLFNAVSQIAKSPEAKVFQQFLQDIAGMGDKIVLGAVFLKVAGAIGTASAALKTFGSQLNTMAAGDLAGGLLAGTGAAHIARGGGAHAVPGLATQGGALAGGTAVSTPEQVILSKLASTPVGTRLGDNLTAEERAFLKKAPASSPLARVAAQLPNLSAQVGGINQNASVQARNIQNEAAKKHAAVEARRASAIAAIDARRLAELKDIDAQLQSRALGYKNPAEGLKRGMAARLSGGPMPVYDLFDPADVAYWGVQEAEINARAERDKKLANARAAAMGHVINGATNTGLAGVDTARRDALGNLIGGASAPGSFTATISQKEKFSALMADRRAMEAQAAKYQRGLISGNAGLTRMPGESLSEFAARNASALELHRSRLGDITEELGHNRTAIYDTEGLTGLSALQRQQVTGFPAFDNLRSRARLGLTNVGNRLQNYGGLMLAGVGASYELNALGRNNDNPGTRAAQFLASGAIGGASIGALGGTTGAIAGGVAGTLKGVMDIFNAALEDTEAAAKKAAGALAEMRENMPVATAKYLERRDAVRALRNQLSDPRSERQRAMDNEGDGYLGLTGTRVSRALRRMFLPGVDDDADDRANSAREQRRNRPGILKALKAAEKAAQDSKIRMSAITDVDRTTAELNAVIMANADAEIKRLNGMPQNSRTADALRAQQTRKRIAEVNKSVADKSAMGGLDAYVESRLKKFDKGLSDRGVSEDTAARLSQAERERLQKEYAAKASRYGQAQISDILDNAGIEKKVAGFTQRAGVAQLTGNGALAGILTTFAHATEATKDIPIAERASFMRKVVLEQAKELARSYQTDSIQRQQIGIAMKQFPAEARIALQKHALEGAGLALEGKKLDLNDERYKLNLDKAKFEATNLVIQANQVALAGKQLDLSNENFGIQHGRNLANFELLNAPGQDRGAAFEDRSRAMNLRLGLRGAQRELGNAQDAPALFYGGLGPTSNIASQLRYRVEAKYAQNFDPQAYEGAYERQLQRQIAGMGDEQLAAQNRVEAAKIALDNENLLKSATELLAQARQDAAQVLKGDTLTIAGQGISAAQQAQAVAGISLAQRGQGLDNRGLALEGQENALARQNYGLKLEDYALTGERLPMQLYAQGTSLQTQYAKITEKLGDTQEAQGALKGEAANLNIPVNITVGELANMGKEVEAVIRAAIEAYFKTQSRIPGNK